MALPTDATERKATPICTGARQAYDRARYSSTRRQAALLGYVRKLSAGIQLAHWGNHHLAMAVIKGPRPSGMTLSLINRDSPDCYDGYVIQRGVRKAYRLSTNPNDYAWESRSDNNRRAWIERHKNAAAN